jgi:hypothetical protein
LNIFVLDPAGTFILSGNLFRFKSYFATFLHPPSFPPTNPFGLACTDSRELYAVKVTNKPNQLYPVLKNFTFYAKFLVT